MDQISWTMRHQLAAVPFETSSCWIVVSPRFKQPPSRLVLPTFSCELGTRINSRYVLQPALVTPRIILSNREGPSSRSVTALDKWPPGPPLENWPKNPCWIERKRSEHLPSFVGWLFSLSVSRAMCFEGSQTRSQAAHPWIWQVSRSYPSLPSRFTHALYVPSAGSGWAVYARNGSATRALGNSFQVRQIPQSPDAVSNSSLTIDAFREPPVLPLNRGSWRACKRERNQHLVRSQMAAMGHLRKEVSSWPRNC